MRLEREGVEHHRNCGEWKGSSRSTATGSRSLGKLSPTVSLLETIAQEYNGVRTWERTVAVGEMRSTAEELSQFAGTLQELLALLRRERVRGGRGLGEGDDWVGHCRPVAGRRRDGGAHLMGRILMGDNTARSQIAITGRNTKVVAQTRRARPIRCQSQAR